MEIAIQWLVNLHWKYGQKHREHNEMGSELKDRDLRTSCNRSTLLARLDQIETLYFWPYCFL